MPKVRAFTLLLVALCWAQPQSGRGDDIVPQTESQPVAEAPSEAEPPKYPDYETALHNQMHTGAEVPLEEPSVRPPQNENSGLVLGLIFLGATLFGPHALRLALALNKRYKFWVPRPAVQTKPAESFHNLLAEDEGFVELMRAMNESFGEPNAAVSPDGHGEAAPAPDQTEFKSSPGETDPLMEFFQQAAERIAIARRLFSELGRAPDAPARQAALTSMLQEVTWLKSNSENPEVLPAWQMAAALDGLLSQLTRNAANVTASALRTVGGALDLLQNLYVPGVRPNLTKNPPVRLLAVDDDGVSRNAVSMALRRVFPDPALAADGQGAIELAAQHPYDVIFLDVEMPGIDGFETCSKIHATEANRTTPVVFVTSHSDFAARAKSAVTGGEDLIGKPFLAFEITVKALTLVMRARLGKNPAETAVRRLSSAAGNEKANVVSGVTDVAAVPLPLSPAKAPEQQPAESPRATRVATSKAEPAAELTMSSDPTAADFAKAFFAHGPAHLEEIRNRLQVARDAGKPAELQDFIGELYVDMHSLSGDAGRAELPAISRLVSALESMLKKLLEKPKLCSASTLDTAAAALELLERLCRAEACPDVGEPAIRILVVDDDPVALRAVAGSVQLVFGRPDSADSGEAALALAADRAFDLIFLDVTMPGIDGFTACARIHETPHNLITPVVFVTGHTDQQSRSQAAAAGGCGFIPKPVLSSQIALTAWTFILAGRLEKLNSAPAVREVEAAVC